MSSPRVLKGSGAAVEPALDAAPWTVDTEAGRRRAELDAAYASGIEEGRRLAESAGAAAVPRLATALERAAVEAREAVASRVAADAALVTELALAVTEWLVGRAVAADPGLVVERVEAALQSLLPTDGPPVVYVAPSAVDVAAEWAGRAGVEVRADGRLSHGEARIDAGAGSADLTFADAVDRLWEVLDGA